MFSLNNQSNADPTDELISISLKTLIDLVRPATSLKQRKSKINSSLSGGFLSRIKGRGMEFDETRLYQPGDDIRNIDWRVTARTNTTHTKLFREERERAIFISVDNRPSMNFATRGVFKSVQAAKLAALLAWVAQLHGDRVGGQIYTADYCHELKPHNGRHAVLRLLNALVHRDNKLKPTDTRLHQVISRLAHHVRPGSLIYLISDFRGLDSQVENHFSKLTQHSDVVLIHVFDPLESSLPDSGRYRFTDGLKEISLDTRDRQRTTDYHLRFDQHQQKLKQLAKKMRMGYIQCSTIDDPVRKLRL